MMERNQEGAKMPRRATSVRWSEGGAACTCIHTQRSGRAEAREPEYTAKNRRWVAAGCIGMHVSRVVELPNWSQRFAWM
jgi:hypothetical protein